ncbi:hypothetical protein PLESTB_001765800 [Pleodorina starrii]|uniref:Uncharacterized protein n=1 Tax=Pleodorina starrii TaxID=330485 RepID=A0A9W6C056_9CHLO|nr:hypothetical protein PLESTB_001765800 [Pleodorina starrii]GLC77306.1 hypothetical protein PLESTF_001917900 [Pleodorina starrii]
MVLALGEQYRDMEADSELPSAANMVSIMPPPHPIVISPSAAPHQRMGQRRTSPTAAAAAANTANAVVALGKLVSEANSRHRTVEFDLVIEQTKYASLMRCWVPSGDKALLAAEAKLKQLETRVGELEAKMETEGKEFAPVHEADES